MDFKWEGTMYKGLMRTDGARGRKRRSQGSKRKGWCAEIRFNSAPSSASELAPVAWSLEPQAPLGPVGQPNPTSPTAKSPAASRVHCRGKSRAGDLSVPPAFWSLDHNFRWQNSTGSWMTREGGSVGSRSAEPQNPTHIGGAGVELETRGEWTAPGPNRVSGVLLVNVLYS